jgi:hypothetical protein
VPNKDSNFTEVALWRNEPQDIDTDVWLPSVPNPLDPGQPAPFIVGPEGSAFGYLEGDPSGTLLAFPFALYNRDGGYLDRMPMESITISNRKAHAPLTANPALPYYAGDYYIGMTDYGQMSGYDPLMYWVDPYNYVWKDGKIINAGNDYDCKTHSWYPWKLHSGTTGMPTLTFVDICSNDVPYLASGIGATGSGTAMHP